MARPEKGADKKTRQVNVALTEAEYAEVKVKADAVGQRVADYARAALLRRTEAARALKAVSALSVPDRLAAHQLARIGANLNQLTRQSHMLGVLPLAELSGLLQEIRTILKKVYDHGSEIQ